MFKNISLGIYYPGNSFLHRLQARTKLLVLFWLIICLVRANHNMWHFAPYIVVVVLTLVGAGLAGITLHHLWERMRLLVLLIVLGAIFFVLFPDQVGKPLYNIGPFHLSYGLLRSAIIIYIIILSMALLLAFLPLPALRDFWRQRGHVRRRLLLAPAVLGILALLFLLVIRNIPSTNMFLLGPLVITYRGIWLLITVNIGLLVLYALSLLLTMTTKPVALIEGLTMLLTPLRWLHLPVDDFALMTLIALRFIPTLIDEAEQLVKAQTARGADFAHGTIRERLQSLASLFVPFMQGTLRRAADLATALEARGYEIEGKQTRLHEKSLGVADYVTLLVVGLVMVGALAL